MYFRIVTILLAIVLISGQGWASTGDRSKKKAEAEQVQTTQTQPKQSKYKTAFSKNCETVESSFLTLHKTKGKFYIEIPKEYLGRELLIASTVTGTSDSDVATLGYKGKQPIHCRFTRRDSSVFLERVTVLPDVADTNKSKNVHLTNLDAVIWGGKLFCESDNGSSVVFDATPLFLKTDHLSPLGSKTSSGLTLKAKLESERSTIDSFKAFSDNVSVKTTLSYSVTTSVLGLLTLLKDAPVSVRTTHTILLLPEEKMRPRLADSRIGIFLTGRKNFDADADKVVTYSVVNRWKLEPSDTAAMLRGELTEPVKPIVFYLDSAFPEQWKEAATEGILRWNKAFEAVGFKDAVRVEPFPEDDPEFDPDNLKYSCIRYVPSSVSNAMGPSWVDPTTGEIINASVIVYNDVVKLINGWRFCQTAQVDESVRAMRMPDDVMKESLAYVLSHEVGHCLGFMHNMAASAAYPVDSLRSATFTQKCGTTPSIMDYARFNYVAQPGDEGVRLTPPDLGVYDYHLVKYSYQPILEAESMEAERPVLEGWIEEKAGDPLYRYGRQQTSWRCDPTAIEEDLGDDAVKASDYGVANLKYILSNMDSWITDEQDADYQHREELYKNILKQYDRYMGAVLLNVGGIRLYDGPDKPRAEAVEAGVQRSSVQWVLERLDDSQWLDESADGQRRPLHVEDCQQFVTGAFSDLMDRLDAVVLSAHIAGEEAYTPQEFMDDIYEYVWEPTRGNKELTPAQRMMQTEFVNNCISAFAPKSSSSSSSSSLTGDDAYGPSLREVACGLYGETLSEMLPDLIDEFGRETVANQVYNFGKAGYNAQKKVSIRTIDETPSLLYDAAVRCDKILASKAVSGPKADRAHYSLLHFKLEKALKNK